MDPYSFFSVAFVIVYLIVQFPNWLTKKALREYNAGHPARAIDWAKRALSCWTALPMVRASAHQVAGLGYSEQGRLEEAQDEYQRSYLVARAAGKPSQAARALVLLSGLQLKRGLVAEALATARQAAEAGTGLRRDALLAEAEGLRTQGRWDEAADALHKAQQTPPFTQPQHELRSQATLCLGLAIAHAEAAQAIADCEMAEQAWAFLEGAAAAFEDDRKLHLWCEAAACWVEALRGNDAEARRVLPLVQAQLRDFAQSRGTLLTAYWALARAAVVMGDFTLGIELWEQYFVQHPEMPGRVCGRYFWGECLMQLGYAAAACEHWRQAVALNVDTYYARCAHRRLAEAEGTIPSEPYFEGSPKSDIWPPPPSRPFPV